MKYFKQQTDLERTYIELYGKTKEVNAENKTKNKKTTIKTYWLFGLDFVGHSEEAQN